MAGYTRYKIFIITFIFIIFTSLNSYSEYITQNNTNKYTLSDISKLTNLIIKDDNLFIIKGNIIISPTDTLIIEDHSIIVYDTSSDQSHIIVKGTIEIGNDIQYAVVNTPVANEIDLDAYIKIWESKTDLVEEDFFQPGLLYDDIGVRMRTKQKEMSRSKITRQRTLFSDTVTTSAITFLVKDDDTSQTLASQIEILTSQGKYIYMKDLSGKDLKYNDYSAFWVDEGVQYTVEIPSGITDITVKAGYEYIPYFQEITISEGEALNLEVYLKRIVNMNAEGWYAGDMHNHLYHGEKMYNVSIPFCTPIIKGLGYDWYAFGSKWKKDYSMTYPSGELDTMCANSSSPSFLCLWGMEYPKTIWGHIGSMGYPVWEDLPVVTDTTTELPNFILIKTIYDRGGVALYTHTLREYGYYTDSNYPGEKFYGNLSRELPFDLLSIPQYIQNIDILTDETNSSLKVDYWFNYLNRGYRIGCSGFCDANMDRDANAVGHSRTYNYINGDITRDKIVSSFKEGRTLATSGPLVLFNIDNYLPGDVIPTDGTPHLLTVKVFCGSRLGYYIKDIDVIKNGVVIDHRDISSQKLLEYEYSLPISETQSCWYIVKCRGTYQDKYNFAQVAFTSPIYFQDSSYVPPAPLMANISGYIYDVTTLSPLPGEVKAYYLDSLVASTTANGEGKFTITAPAASIIKVNYGSGTEVQKNIILDYEPLRYHLLKIRKNDIINWSYYNDIINLCKNVYLNIALNGTLSTVSKFINGPYLQNVTSNSITIMWETDINFKGRVEYSETTVYENFVNENSPNKIHKIILLNLKPSTKYHYRVITGSTIGSDHTFITAPTKTNGFAFGVYGNTYSDSDECKTISTMLKDRNPSFVIHTGNFVSDASSTDIWKNQFFTPAANLLYTVPLYPCQGDKDSVLLSYYYQYFPISIDVSGENWYSFDYSNAHFVVLNTEEDCTTDSYQLKWLIDDLESTQKEWIFVIENLPLYSSGNESNNVKSQELRDALIPIFEQHQVDAVFSGHDSFYERSDKNGVKYIVTGGGGAPLTQPNVIKNTYQEVANKSYNYCFIAINQLYAEFYVYNDNYEEIDYFNKDKDYKSAVDLIMIDAYK